MDINYDEAKKYNLPCTPNGLYEANVAELTCSSNKRQGLDQHKTRS
jgi:hypothetical protein